MENLCIHKLLIGLVRDNERLIEDGNDVILNFEDADLDDEAGKFVASYLKLGPYLHELDLSNNSFSAETLFDIIESTLCVPTLRKLSFRGSGYEGSVVDEIRETFSDVYIEF